MLIDDRQRIDHKDPHSTCMLFLRLCMPVGIDHGAKKNRVDRITHSLEISTVPLRKSRRRPTPFGIWTWEPPLVGTNCSCTSKSGSPRKDRHCYCSAISIAPSSYDNKVVPLANADLCVDHRVECGRASRQVERYRGT